MNHIVYQLHRHRFAGWSLLRWLVSLLLLAALLAALRLLPGGWVSSGVALMAALALVVLYLRARRRLFVRFRPAARPSSPREGNVPPLLPGEQIPVRVTGVLTVGNREQVLVHAPGYLERFRNGEIAIAALVPPSRFLGLGALPPKQEGMWYAFVDPGRVRHVDAGEVVVRGARLRALSVAYETGHHTARVYLAFEREEDLRRALAAFLAA